MKQKETCDDAILKAIILCICRQIKILPTAILLVASIFIFTVTISYNVSNKQQSEEKQSKTDSASNYRYFFKYNDNTFPYLLSLI